MAAKNIYEVTVEGQYYALAGSKKDTKHYSIKFRADDTIKKSGFLSAFRNALIAKSGVKTAILNMMLQKYPDYKRFRTHHIEEVVNLTYKNKPVKELALMNYNQIVRFIDWKQYPVDIDLYPTITDLRQAVKDYRGNPEVFIKQQEKRRATKGPEIAVQSAIERLNNPEYTPPKPGSAKELPGDDIIINDEDEDDMIDGNPRTPTEDDEGYIDDEDTDTETNHPGIPEFDDEDELEELLQGV